MCDLGYVNVFLGLCECVWGCVNVFLGLYECVWGYVIRRVGLSSVLAMSSMGEEGVNERCVCVGRYVPVYVTAWP